MLKTSTLIKQSPKKLDVASLMADITTASKTVTLLSLESLDDFQKVTENIKVVELKDETQVGGRVKRDVSVADESGMARVKCLGGKCECNGERSKLLPQEFHGARVSEDKICHNGQVRLQNHPPWGHRSCG